jgi:hypothetical protein
MPKIMWLALLCAPLVGALFILTTIIKAGTPSVRPATMLTAVETTPSVSKRDETPLTKADRLPLSELGSLDRDADTTKLVPTQVEQTAPPPPAISPTPSLASKQVATSSTRPTRRHAAKSSIVGKRSQPARLQQAPPSTGGVRSYRAVQSGGNDGGNDVTSWHWHAGSEVIKRTR